MVCPSSPAAPPASMSSSARSQLARLQASRCAGSRKPRRALASMPQNPDDLPKEDVLDRLLVKNLVDYAIFVVSLEGVITLWNVGAERIFGYAEGVIVGQHFGLLFTPEDVAAGAPQAELTKIGRASCRERG